MAIPDFQTQMLPVLRASAVGEVKISEVVVRLGSELGLTEEELSELVPSGKQSTFANRVNWAMSYLGKAGLITLILHIPANEASQSDPKKPLIPVTALPAIPIQKSHPCDLTPPKT
jgi:restriction endonuclease Mrr